MYRESSGIITKHTKRIDPCPKMLTKLSEKMRQQEEGKDELVSPFTHRGGCVLGGFNPSRNPSLYAGVLTSEDHSS